MPRGAVAPRQRALRAGPGARVLRLDRGRRGARQPDRREAGVQGPAAARAAPRCGSPPTTRSRAASSRGRDGFAVACAKHEPGMLLARVRPDAIASSGDGVLRGVFEAGDAWLETGDLFRRDVDGDFWLVDHVPSLIRTAARRRPDGPDPGRARRRRGGRARGRLRRPAKDGSAPDPVRGGHRSARATSSTSAERRARPRRPRRRRHPLGDPGRRRDPADHLVPAEERAAARRGPAGADEAADRLVLGPEEGRLPGAEQGRRRAAAARAGRRIARRWPSSPSPAASTPRRRSSSTRSPTTGATPTTRRSAAPSSSGRARPSRTARARSAPCTSSARRCASA